MPRLPDLLIARTTRSWAGGTVIEIRFTLQPVLDSIRIARGLAAQLPLRPADMDLVRTVVSELASNAIAHAATPFTVTLDADDDTAVRVSVSDGSPDEPVMQPLDPNASRGRGMRIVAALADDWGITRHAGDGKTVWAIVTSAYGDPETRRFSL